MHNEELRAAVGREVERVANERDGEEQRANPAPLTLAAPRRARAGARIVSALRERGDARGDGLRILLDAAHSAGVGMTQTSCEPPSTGWVGPGERAGDGSNMEHAMRLIHWYDLEYRRVACGARGQINSTKHHRDVTCTACLACLEERRTSLCLVPSNDPVQ